MPWFIIHKILFIKSEVILHDLYLPEINIIYLKNKVLKCLIGLNILGLIINDGLY